MFFTRVRLHIILFCGLCYSISLIADTLKYTPPMSANDPQKAYFIGLLERVCQHSNQLGTRCELDPVIGDMYQQRQLRSLDTGVLDVVWTVTSIERERDYLSVRIPLTKGLIGYRIAVINNKVLDAFKRDSPLNPIKQLKHVQGHDWPDTEILRFNHFQVSTTSWYSTLYKSLDAYHFDVLLRGALEVVSEFEEYPSKNLSIDTWHAFYYPSAVYFFVSKQKPELAEMLNISLTSLISSGEFDRLLFEFEPHALALSKLKLEQRKLHLLENPLLPKETPLGNSALWYVN